MKIIVLGWSPKMSCAEPILKRVFVLCLHGSRLRVAFWGSSYLMGSLAFWYGLGAYKVASLQVSMAKIQEEHQPQTFT